MRVIFVDEHNSSKYNGIGTYRDVLMPRLSAKQGVELVLVSLNSDCDNLEAKRRLDFGNCLEYALPYVARGDWRSNGDIIWPLMKRYINDSPSNIFIINHSPSAEFITSLKRIFPKSKVIFVIHDQGWCASLFGNRQQLAAIERGEYPEGISRETCDNIRKYCDREREIYRQVDAIVCLSESTELLLHNVYGVKPEHIILIHNGYETAVRKRRSKTAERQRLGLRDDDELLVFVARPVPHKGIMALLKALEIIVRKRPLVRCVLAGSPKGFVNFWNMGANISPRLILAGQQNAKELRHWYAAADVGVLSSYTEQCSFAALEMMASGLPIVSSDGNGLCDMFTDEKNAYVASIGNYTDLDAYSCRLAAKIEQALDATDAERRRMIAGGRHLLRFRYSADDMTNAYIGLFRKLTD